MSRLSAATFSTSAVVLRARPLGEKDRMVTLLSPAHGKIASVAKGARGPKSKLAAVSQPFTLMRCLLARGRTFAIISQAQIENAHTHIAADLGKIAWASYCCELCDALPDEMPDESLFELLCVVLAQLDAAPPDALAKELIGRWFEARFLALLGYSPTVGRCVACGQKLVVAPDDQGQKIAFSPPLGGTLCRTDAAREAACLFPSAGALRLLHRLERLDAPPSSDDLELTTATRRDLRDVLRASVGAHLGLKLRSLRFLDDVTAEGMSGEA